MLKFLSRFELGTDAMVQGKQLSNQGDIVRQKDTG